MTKKLFGVKGNKFGSTVIHKDFDGVVHLTEFSDEDLVDLVQQDMMLH